MTPPSPPSSNPPGARELVLTGLLCLLLALLFTWPLMQDPGGRFLDGKFQWSHGWAMEVVHLGAWSDDFLNVSLPALDPQAPSDEGRDPWVLTMGTRMLNYPEGGSVVFLGWFNILLGVALRRLFNVVAAFNLGVVAVLALAPWGAWWLARQLGAGWWGALSGGVIYGFSPFIVGVVGNGQVAKYNHAWIPLLALVVSPDCTVSWAVRGTAGRAWNSGLT